MITKFRNRFLNRCCLASILFAACVPADAAEQEATPVGTVKGTVTYKADASRPWQFGRYYIARRKTGELAEAVVCLSGSSLKKLPAPKEPMTWKIDQKDFRFIPETVAIRAGDRVKFLNNDPQLHNVNSRSDIKPLDISVKPGGEIIETFPRAGNLRQPITIGCKLHSVMKSWIFVFDHPFYVVTGAEGQFEFKDVPAGEYRLECAHPAGGLRWSQKITVKAGETLSSEIVLSPDQLAE